MSKQIKSLDLVKQELKGKLPSEVKADVAGIVEALSRGVNPQEVARQRNVHVSVILQIARASGIQVKDSKFIADTSSVRQKMAEKNKK